MIRIRRSHFKLGSTGLQGISREKRGSPVSYLARRRWPLRTLVVAVVTVLIPRIVRSVIVVMCFVVGMIMNIVMDVILDLLPVPEWHCFGRLSGKCSLCSGGNHEKRR